MKFNILLTGVGGEGVLTSQVIIARAANLEGYFVRGVQLHGLAQRGGSVPTMVRFGSADKIYSPSIMQANADLILAFEPLEAVRAVYYARPEQAIFVINTHPYIPVYSHLLNIPYPRTGEIERRIKPFAKEIYLCDATSKSLEKFGNPILANTILIGVALGLGALPLRQENVKKAIELTAPGKVEENLQAFESGLKLGGI
jgi:indolepyruvate ferredoxin oxidoreductase beta subunit